MRWSCVTVAGVLAASAPLAISQTPPEPAPDEPVLTARELFSDPQAMTEGANVRLDSAVIRAKSGNVLRVATEHHEIFVAPNDPSSLNYLTSGARIEVLGTLRRSPSARQAQLVYAMPACDARRLARTRFYIDAWDVMALE